MTEEEYLLQYDAASFDRPSVTADILIFTVRDKRLRILLVRRDTPPFQGKWAIPGGFVRMEESAEQAAARRIREEAGVEDVHLEQLYTFSAVDRDPRTRVISIAYLATVPSKKLLFSAGTEVTAAALFSVELEDGQLRLTRERAEKEADPARDGAEKEEDPAGEDKESLSEEDLAFDHAAIIRTAVERMRGKIDYTDLAFGFLEAPESFTLTELRVIFEAVLGRPLDIGNFRRTIKRVYESTGRIVERERERGVVGRPAMLYRYIP